MRSIYVRVSSKGQDTRSQEAELRAWANGQSESVEWYKDKATGTNFNRPGWQRLWADVLAGKVSKVVVWRLDRLGRTVRELVTIFEELDTRKVGFLSLRDGFDPSTPAGRLTRNVLASVAQFETEVRSERQLAGIDAARQANGGKCPWGGRKKGAAVKATPEKVKAVKAMHADGKPISEIAHVVGLGRQSVYRILGRWQRRLVRDE